MDSIYSANVLAETVAIRKGPGINFATVDGESYSNGDTFLITETEMDGSRIWGRSEKGWVCLINGTNRFIDYRPYQKPKRVMRARALNANTASGGSNSSGSGGANNVDTSNINMENMATQETFNNVFTELMGHTTASSEAMKRNMRLFGLPYQFRPEIDIRNDKISKTLGRKFVENIVTEAPVVTIIPGVPKYLPAAKDRSSWTRAFVESMSGNFSALQQITEDSEKTQRYYDFQNAYTQYMTYVNILCRTAATFLEITDLFDIDNVPLQSYDWRNYRWSDNNYQSVASKLLNADPYSVVNGLVNKVKQFGASAADAAKGVMAMMHHGKGDYDFQYTTTDASENETDMIDTIMQSANFVQFYMDPDNGTNESASNSTSESKLKGAFDTGSDAMKELAFVMNSGGTDQITKDFGEFTTASLQALSDNMLSGGSTVSSFMKRMMDVGTNVVKGENVIMPEIYNNSQYDRRFSITIHLKAPYGNRYSYFLDVLVPLFHLMALALPRQTTANTYKSPFIVKAFCEGVFTCNLGIVTSINVNKNVSPESWTNDGFPSEVDVQLEIADLYSDLTMSPQTEPAMFVGNSSLIEYLATTCGLNLVQPQMNNRMKMVIQTVITSFGSIPQNVFSEVGDKIGDLIAPWTSIT